ncbi:MAG TPA: hypothetical protein VLB68_16575 [Pyrinomonadaceae bacterium]|nr:hypothetical protein [Pyrinomonadaceae bacterium]
MARGWESKSVADQIEEGKSRVVSDDRGTSPEERLKAEKLQSLLLSKARLLDQLERAKNPAYREMLLKGLSAIEDEIKEL